MAVGRDDWALALSRYVHLNPVRTGKLGLGKSDQQRVRAGVSPAPESAQVEERIAALRRHRWSSYRAYIGLARQPDWLECDELLSLGGGEKGQERRHYQDYVESAVREGLKKSPWEDLREQAVLGSQAFLEELRTCIRGDKLEQRGARRLRLARLSLAAVIQAVQKVKCEPWETFRDRHGDRGRDLVLFLGRRMCGLKLKELARESGLAEYAGVAMAVKRYEALRDRDPVEQACFRQVVELLNVKI